MDDYGDIYNSGHNSLIAVVQAQDGSAQRSQNRKSWFVRGNSKRAKLKGLDCQPKVTHLIS